MVVFIHNSEYGRVTDGGAIEATKNVQSVSCKICIPIIEHAQLIEILQGINYDISEKGSVSVNLRYISEVRTACHQVGRVESIGDIFVSRRRASPRVEFGILQGLQKTIEAILVQRLANTSLCFYFGV
jgi:hypothetical protein